MNGLWKDAVIHVILDVNVSDDLCLFAQPCSCSPIRIGFALQCVVSIYSAVIYEIQKFILKALTYHDSLIADFRCTPVLQVLLLLFSENRLDVLIIS